MPQPAARGRFTPPLPIRSPASAFRLPLALPPACTLLNWRLPPLLPPPLPPPPPPGVAKSAPAAGSSELLSGSSVAADGRLAGLCFGGFGAALPSALLSAVPPRLPRSCCSRSARRRRSSCALSCSRGASLLASREKSAGASASPSSPAAPCRAASAAAASPSSRSSRSRSAATCSATLRCCVGSSLIRRRSVASALCCALAAAAAGPLRTCFWNFLAISSGLGGR
mmetsp:Transcript_11759/g.37657  ORF Transcript_11759/g.37657 Transcript_11759/m.37657 type:complete len:226 (+) Transcript_11759:1230-1907(+)